MKMSHSYHMYTIVNTACEKLNNTKQKKSEHNKIDKNKLKLE